MAGFLVHQRRSSIEADNLLPLGMNSACEDAGFGGRLVRSRDDDVADIDSETREKLDEALSFGIVADDADRNRMSTERSEIVNCVGSSAGHDLRFTVIKDKYWGFTRDSRNFAVYEHVRHEIAENDNAPAFEPVDDLG